MDLVSSLKLYLCHSVRRNNNFFQFLKTQYFKIIIAVFEKINYKKSLGTGQDWLRVSLLWGTQYLWWEISYPPNIPSLTY